MMRILSNIFWIILWSIGSGITAGIFFYRAPEKSFHTRNDPGGYRGDNWKVLITKKNPGSAILAAIVWPVALVAVITVVLMEREDRHEQRQQRLRKIVEESRQLRSELEQNTLDVPEGKKSR